MQNIARKVDALTQGLKYSISGVMNLTNQAAARQSGVYFVNFNQDCTSLTVGSKAGYKFFSLNSVDHLETIYENGTEDACIVEQLFNCSLMAMVNFSSPRKLKVCHFRRGTEICNYSYSNTILSVKLNRARLVVCLEESLYIHTLKDMTVLHTIRDTPPNLAGLCTLSINSDNCYLAYPGSNTIGEVQIFDAINLQAKTMIPAHDSPLAALKFNPNATKIATASEKGTVIRVFHVHDGTKLFEFRRGVKRCVSISSLAFSMDSMFLCCSSNTETVHIFKLEEPKEAVRQATEESQTWMGYLTKAVSASANYLPSQVTNVFNQGRAFASVHLPFQGLKNACAITEVHNVLRLLVASADGYLYVYNLDTTEGGDCTLLKQHRLVGKPDEVDCASVSTVGSGSGEANAATTAQIVQNTDCASASTVGSGSGKTNAATNAATTAATTAQIVQNTACINSYADVLRGRSPDSMSESEKCHEMIAAAESPPIISSPVRLKNNAEYPPITSWIDY